MVGDAMPSASEEMTLAEEGKAEVAEGEEHGKIEEEAQGKAEEETQGKAEEETQGKTDEEQGKSAEDIEDQKNGGDGEGDEEEEPGECGFCLFMKSGPCGDSFISWEQCIEQAEKDKEDMVEKCHKVTFMLKECMERNSDYYEPVLQAEKAMGDAALEEEEEAAAAAAAEEEGANASPPDSQVHSQSGNRISLDAPQSQAPPHVDAEELNIPTEEHPIQASSEKNHIHTSSDAPAEALNAPNSEAAGQERSSA